MPAVEVSLAASREPAAEPTYHLNRHGPGTICKHKGWHPQGELLVTVLHEETHERRLAKPIAVQAAEQSANRKLPFFGRSYST